MNCKICGFEEQNIRKFSNHLKKNHSKTCEDYTITNLLDGVRPQCFECTENTRYVSFSFKDYCKNHSTLAMSKAGARGGKAEAWNKGLNKETDVRIKNASEKMTGERNHFWNRHHSQKTRERISSSKRLNGATIEDRIQLRQEEFEVLTNLDEYISKQKQYLLFKCKKCQTEQEKTLQAFERGSLCEKCSPNNHSQWELEVYEFVKTVRPNAKLGDRKIIKPKEIDVWIQEDRFGIECHGLYFHSDEIDNNENKKHAIKADLANKSDVRLLQIFWDEWRDNKEIVKSMITHRLGFVQRKFMARKCEIREVNAIDQKEFFIKSHISGYARSSKAWGLYINNELLSCLSIRTPRQTKWKDYLEVARFATLPDVLVTGGLSKLIKAAFNFSLITHTGLMTYIDKRVGNGKSYVHSGFKLVGETKPDYWYTDCHVRFDRFKFRAKDGLSEKEVASKAKMRKIYGAGSFIAIMR